MQIDSPIAGAKGMICGGGPSSTKSHAPLRVMVFSTLYPSAARPRHGVFVETRLQQLLGTDAIDARVVAPVPWFPSTHARFGAYAALARTQRDEVLNGVRVLHPRYPLPPRVGMTVAPVLLALGAIGAVRRLRAEGFDFDLIDAHYFYPDGVAAALLATWCERPFVVTARGSDLNVIANHHLPRSMMQWAARRAAANIAVSQALADIIHGWGIDREHVHVLRNGVDAQRFRPMDRREARQQLGIVGGPVLAIVGNLVAVKRHRFALETLAALTPEHPRAQLLVVGDGPLRADLQACAAALGIAARVHFAGTRPQSELPIWYSAADLLLLPSEFEGWPNVALEAMACGTPVVASRVGGLPEIVTRPDVGLLVDPNDPTAFVDATHQLLSRSAARTVVRAYAESMGWKPTTSALIDLFCRVARSSVDCAQT